MCVFAGQLTAGVGHKVYAGMSPVQLAWLPSDGTAPACIYAQSSKAVLLRSAPSNPPTGEPLQYAPEHPYLLPVSLLQLLACLAVTQVAAT